MLGWNTGEMWNWRTWVCVPIQAPPRLFRSEASGKLLLINILFWDIASEKAGQASVMLASIEPPTSIGGSMLFGTKVEWAESNPIFRAVSAPYSIFDTFEIMYFSIFYILETQLEVEEGVTLGRLFLIENFERVLEILSDPKTKKHSLLIFVPGRYNEIGSCSIHKVKKIYQGVKEEHWGIYTFECTDRKFSSNNDANSLSEKDVICIYPLISGRKKRKADSERDRKLR
jgi:hypothetical protein